MKDSISSWYYQNNMHLNSDTNTSRYNYWGYSPVLKFNAKKSCFFMDVYFAIRIHPDTIKKHDKTVKAYDEQIARGEYYTKKYMGSEIIVDPKGPDYLQEYVLESYIVKIKNGKLQFIGSTSGGMPESELGHAASEKKLLECLYKNQSYIVSKNSSTYCLSEYFQNLDEKSFE